MATKKAGRNKDKCKLYKATGQRERNKARKVAKDAKEKAYHKSKRIRRLANPTSGPDVTGLQVGSSGFLRG